MIRSLSTNMSILAINFQGFFFMMTIKNLEPEHIYCKLEDESIVNDCCFEQRGCNYGRETFLLDSHLSKDLFNR